MIIPRDQYYVTREASSDYSDYWGETIDPDGKVRDRLSEQERRQYLRDVIGETEFVKYLVPKAILDVGCGPGWFLSQFEAIHKAGTEVSETAEREATKYGIAVWRSLIQIPSFRFDVVRCHHVIEHMEHPIHELQQMHRLCKPGGWLLLSTPDFGSPCAERFGDRYRMLHDKTHCSLFTLESTFRFVRDHGFAVRRVTYPFPRRYQRAETMQRWREKSDMSPPFPGNWFTMYATRD